MYSLYVCLILVSLLAICHGNDIVFISQTFLNKSPFETGQCPFNEISLRIANGYISNTVNIYITTTNLAYGYLEYACASGYTLNPTIGSRLTCNSNGSWSTLPVCQFVDRCPTIPLFTFLLGRSTLIAMTFNGNHSLPRNGTGNGNVISGTFVPMICRDGHVNAGGPLNITCVGGSWTPFPNCVLYSDHGPVIIEPDNGAPCPVNLTSISIENGLMTDTSAPQLPMVTTYSGWAYFNCLPGYTLDPAIGALYICNNGVWSTKPRCLKIGRCSLSSFTTFVSSATGLQTTGQTQLLPTTDDSTVVLNGSYAVFSCMSDYTNMGGSLNVTCSANGTWSPFPSCVKNSDNGGSIMTTMMPGIGARCQVISITFFVPYGFLTNTTAFILYEDNTASGWVMFGCPAGFAIDSVTNGVLSCNNGVWSSRPQCLRTPRCYLPYLETFILHATGIQSNGPPHLLPTYDDSNLMVPSGSYAVFSCMSGYTNMGGSLNVTCSPTGRWSPLPNCVSGTQMTTVPPIGGSACPYSYSILTIPNGYASNLNGLMLSTANQAASGSFVDYQCIPPYTLSGNSRITCASGAWSAQPMCMAPVQVNTTTTTTLSPLQCVGIPSVSNAYISNATRIYLSNNNYQGQIHFTCNPGYRHVNTSGARWVSCTNGVWSALPVCAVSPVCSVSELQAALVNMTIVSHSLSAAPDGGILAGGWIQLHCAPNFNLNPFSGSLNVTCQATGRWTRFPICS